MKKYSLLLQKCFVDVNRFCELLIPILKKYGLEENFSLFIKELRKKGNNETFNSHSPEDFGLTKELETLFFKSLLGEIGENCILTKYTNLDCLFRIVKDNEISMTSLVGMNDSTECYYVDSYLSEHGGITFLTNSDNTYWGTYSFVTSFTDLQDDLTMWRLYGNDASGINIQFKLVGQLKDDFILSPVSYANKDGSHPKLDLIADVQNLAIENMRFAFRCLHVWRYFFKPYQYSVENEIRLLYEKDKPDDQLTWIQTGIGIISSLTIFSIEEKSKNKHPLYPLVVRGITLGPQFVESNINLEVIKIMLQAKYGWTEKDVKIKTSCINNYRKNKK